LKNRTNILSLALDILESVRRYAQAHTLVFRILAISVGFTMLSIGRERVTERKLKLIGFLAGAALTL
jgi:hypothetical protein